MWSRSCRPKSQNRDLSCFQIHRHRRTSRRRRSRHCPRCRRYLGQSYRSRAQNAVAVSIVPRRPGPATVVIAGLFMATASASARPPVSAVVVGFVIAGAAVIVIGPAGPVLTVVTPVVISGLVLTAPSGAYLRIRSRRYPSLRLCSPPVP